MPNYMFRNMRIAGVAAAAPSAIVVNRDYEPLLGKSLVDRVISVTGIEQYHKSARCQTASDLAYVAAEKLLSEKNVDRSEIGAIIDVTESPDYIAPSTAFVLHKRLKLPQTCMAFDVNLGCTGYVYGIHIACSLLQAMTQKYVLLVVGDVMKRPEMANRRNPDHSYLMMFGDASTVTLIEKTETSETIETDLYADGTDFKMLYTMGRCRCPDAPHDVTVWSDGLERSLYDPYMDGMGVFVFSTTYAPKTVKDFLKKRGESLEQYDGFYFHQANKMIVDRIARCLKIDMEKVPLSLPRYGNTNCGSIPVTIVDHLGDMHSNIPQKLLLCGYGIGLSWGCVSLSLCPDAVLPMEFSDEYYAEGEIHPL